MVSARLSRARAWLLALGATMLLAAGPGETDVEVQLTGTGGRYARVCGGYQDLGSAQIKAQLEGDLPGESDHALLVEGWVESGLTRDSGFGTPEAPGRLSAIGALSLSMGYSRRWGELATGVVVLGTGPDDLQPLPTGRLRVGPQERLFWTAELVPDLRAAADYALRTELHLRLAVPPEVWLHAGLTGAGHDFPQPVIGVRFIDERGVGLQSSFAMAADDRNWWYFQAGLVFAGSVKR